LKLKAISENEIISAQWRSRRLHYKLACATMLYMISENHAPSAPTAHQVQSRQESEIGLGMARSKLGTRSAVYPEVPARHAARVKRSFLGRLHMEKKENG